MMQYVVTIVPEWKKGYGPKEEFDGDKVSQMFGPFKTTKEATEYAEDQSWMDRFSVKQLIKQYDDDRPNVEKPIIELIEFYELCKYERVCVVTNGPKHHRYVYEVQSVNYVGWIEFNGKQTTVDPEGNVLT